MQLLRVAFLSLSFVTLILNVYIYFYPVFRGCGFPTRDGHLSNQAHSWTQNFRRVWNPNPASSQDAEFRLLVFGDPQLEGDTSIWHPHRDALYRPEVLLQRLRSMHSLEEKLYLIRDAARDAITKALPKQLAAWRKQIDLVGNDYYLAHIYRTLHAYTKPTHVSVVGDLLGSQWITDEEFSRRAWRFWQRVFRNGIRVDDQITEHRREEPLGADADWERRIINIAGNHDVGYAGDMTVERLSRFEGAFGKANWELKLHHPQRDESTNKHPSLRIVVLNSMNLDTPAKSPDLQAETYGFLNRVIMDSAAVEDRSVGTIVLTHIPLHKENGTCVDGPFVDFYGADRGHGLKEQNHISYDAGLGILQGIFGMSADVSVPGGGLGRDGIILNGHDHEGCDVYHYIPQGIAQKEEVKSPDSNNEPSDAATPSPALPRWTATPYHPSLPQISATAIPGIREVTLRSMMGEFGGYAYMLSAWFEFESEAKAETDAKTDTQAGEEARQGKARQGGKWRFEVNRCGAGVQHWWWAAHIALLVTVGVGGAVGVEGARGAVRKGVGVGKDGGPKDKRMRTAAQGQRREQKQKQKESAGREGDEGVPGLSMEKEKEKKHTSNQSQKPRTGKGVT